MKITFINYKDNLYQIAIEIEVTLDYIYSSTRNPTNLIKIDSTKYTEWLDSLEIKYSIESHFESYNGYVYRTTINGLSEEEAVAFGIKFSDDFENS